MRLIEILRTSNRDDELDIVGYVGPPDWMPEPEDAARQIPQLYAEYINACEEANEEPDDDTFITRLHAAGFKPAEDPVIVEV